MKHSLEVYLDNRIIFFSDGKWLHPLLDLHEFLEAQHYDPQRLVVNDKIVGKAAALIQVHLGIKHIHASMLSQLARDVFEDHNIHYEFDQLVDRIQCRTEDLLLNETNPETAFRLILKLAGR
ncbi:MAG: DUF1893 domain-containing protein [candidate division KSB1 bacterium]|nr:DUF1893 domain-containing protein [candidate division KSB1 bacterium]MDZ7317542.1 DUF1893 domain-containing protein [candidate division KSB1 bacterium]MDZ7340935.1 DUF1893 domain-containing protein [candidate division KSB1 bacterium]